MNDLKKRTMVLIQLLLMLCCLVSTVEAKNFTLRNADNVDTFVKVDDSTSSLTGLNSFQVDGIERGFQQWFWYRVGPDGPETSLDLLAKKTISTQTSLNAPNLTTTYTLAGQFDIKVLYELTSSPLGAGKASLKKTVTIYNTSAVDLDYHFFEYSDYDLSDTGTAVGDNDNIEAHNNRVYQNGSQYDSSGITYTHESSLPPSSYDLDDGSGSLIGALRDIDPSDFYTPQTPYGYGSDRQFVKQWDLTIPAGQSVSFTITDNFYPTKPVTASVTNSPACVTYGGTTSYTINFDNLLNTAPLTESLTNVKLIDFLPNGITPATIPPTDGSVYDAVANTVSWNIPSLAPAAAQQTRQLNVSVNSAADFTNEILLVSDQAFPTRVPIQDPALDPIITNKLCNHPPSIFAIKDASVNEGSAFSAQIQANANDVGQTLAYSLSGAPAGMTISATGLISYPVAVAGDYSITVTVTDNGAGALKASDSFILKVNKVNKLPVFTSTPTTSAIDYQLYSYTLTATDPDGDTLSYGLTVAPTGMTLSGNVISWTPTNAQAGLQAVQVFVNDGNGGRVYQNFSITVTHVNRPPVITSAAPTAPATVNVFYSYPVVASDPDGDALTYSLPVKPAGMTIGTTGVIGWTATAAQNNLAHDVTVQVSDGLGGIATQSFKITVGIAGKQTPVITWATPAAISFGTALSATQLNASANVPGSFTYTPAAGTLLTAGIKTLSATFTPSDTAAYNTATASVQLTVNKASATVTLSNLTQTYNGAAKPVTVTTNPGNLAVTVTYAGSTTAPTAAGSYAVAATVNDNDYTGSASGTLTIAKATQTISAITFTPSALNVGGTTTVSATATSGLAVVFTSNTPTICSVSGSTVTAIAAGTCTIAANQAGNTNYNAATQVTGTVTIAKATATITLGNLSQTYSGTARYASATTIPANLTVNFTYNGSTTAPTAAGSYTVVGTINNANYSGSASGTLTIAPATATVTLGNLSQTYSGTAKAATATTSPTGLAVNFTYNGSATAPTAAGNYTVVGTINNANYSGSASGTLTISKATPVITWATPAAVYVGSALSTTQLNAAVSGGVAGSFVYTPASGTVMNTAGSQTLSATFNPTDTANYNTVTASVTLAVNNKTTPVITWATPAAITYGTALSASQLNATVSGGVAGSFSYSPAINTVLNAGSQTLNVTFTPTNTTAYNTATATVTLTVNKAAATVALSGLTATYDGTAKAATATTTPAGKTVAITYAGSTTAPTAAGTYAVVATINDTNYSGSANGTLTIAKATPTITWATPAAVYVGSVLSATQLNATASTAGTFAYTPASGTVLNTAGNQTLSATFTPTNTANYNNATASVVLAVNTKTTPTITWATPAAITYGTALSATQLNAAVSGGVAGTFSYSPASGTVLNASSQTLAVTFTPTNTTIYNTATATVTLTVNKATATVALSGLTATYDGTAKAATATTTPAGKTVAITYAGSTTAPTAAGTYAVVATVTDANYSGSANGTLTIAKATPTITWATPAPVYVGSVLSATQLNATANAAGTFVYTPAAGTVMNTAGNQTLSVTFNPTDTANYNSATASVTLAVNNKTTPVITWATPAAITYGTALSASQLNATVSGGVAGSFSYSPAINTVLNAGSQTLNVTFTPTNTTAYNTATATVTLTVNKAAATVALSGLTATYDGTAKAATATTTPAGKTVAITYAGSTTAPTAAGTYAVVATINDANYSGSANGTLTIAKATPTITWATPAPVFVGSALTSAQLNATANAAGTFVYTPAAGTVMNTAGSQTLKADFTPADTNNYNTATATVNLTVSSKTNPVITWTNPAAITYGTLLSATQLNATADVAGTFSYAPAAGTTLNVGTQTLTATFTPTDTVKYNSMSKSVSVTVTKANATVALGALNFTYDGSAKSTSATTVPAGLAVAITYAGSPTAPTAAGSYPVVATINDANYSGSANGTLVIAKATPTITWATPAPVFVGSTLSSAQLNATANAAGTFAYTPTAGTAMNTAGNQTLSVAFTSSDSNYTNAAATVVLTVSSKTNPVITWAAPAAITYGTLLSATQLNATADVAGTFSYAPAAGATLNVGTQTLTATFTPTDTVKYNSISKSVSITVTKANATVALGTLNFTYDGSAKSTSATTVPAGLAVAITYAGSTTAPTAAGTYAVVATINDANYSGSANGTLTIAKATPTITWATPTPVFVGSALSSAQLNATANAAGTFVYTPAAGTVMNTAGSQTLKADFTPADTNNYNTGSASVTLLVNTKQNPSISWATPSAITYGTALSATQLNASAGTVAGTFSYTPASGTLLKAGTETLTATFTPDDTTTYNSATASVTVTINKAVPVITWPTPAAVNLGTVLSAAQLNASASVAGKFTYTPAEGTIMNTEGAQKLTAAFTPDDAANYDTASATVSITVNGKQKSVIIWATPAAITYGTELSATQLNATASVPGTFTYTPAAGAILNAGSQTLSVTFTPADALTYSAATASVTLTVNKATPTVTWPTPATVEFGTVLSAEQLNATASVPGSFVYTPAAGSVLNPAGTKTLSTVFTPADTTNYNNVTASVTVAVNPAPNQAPSMTAIAGATITAPAAFSRQVVATDPENQALNYSLSGNPAGMSISGNGLISWNSSVAGTYTITVTATDPGSLSASQNFTLTVNSAPLSQAPVITSLPLLKAYDDGYYYYAVTASDPNGDVLTYSLTTRPSGMTINATTGLIYWRPSEKGTYSVTVKVSDSTGLSTSQSFRVSVVSRPDNNSPRISSSPVTKATVAELYSYDVNATDSNGDTPYFRLTTAPSGMAIDLNSGLISWIPTAAQIGSQRVTVEALDIKGGKTSQSFTITVSAAAGSNTQPTISNPGDRTSTKGSPVSLQIQASDPEGDTLSYSASGLPSGLAINSSTGLISGSIASDASASYTTLVTVSDGSLTDSVSFTWSVTSASTTNARPVITSTALTSAYRYQQYNYAVAASDPDGDTLKYELTSKPSGMTINSSTGLISWKPYSTGSYSIRIKVSDSKGAYTTQSYTLTVKWASISGSSAIFSGSSIFDAVSQPGIARILEAIRGND